MIACKAIISQNYASYFTGACSHFSDQVTRLHGGAHLETHRYKKWILEVSHSGGGQGHVCWMCGGCDGGGRGGRGGGLSQTMISGVEVSYPTRNFTAKEWNSLVWNDGKAYVANVQECINLRGNEVQGGGRDVSRGYGCGGSPHNVNNMKANKEGGHDEVHQGEKIHGQGGQGQGRGHGVGNGGGRGGHNDTLFGRGVYR